MLIWKVKQSFRRILSDKNLAQDNLIILCNPRSGSTWLLDALRCHPKIEIRKSGGLYNAFGLDGKRYPGDLSQQEDAELEIEVLPQVFTKIPNPQIPQQGIHQSLSPTFAIEKIHPEFYHFNTKKFIRQLRKAEKKGKNFKFILLMRPPISAMKSFYSYQKRNPDWYDWMNEKELVNYTLKTFESMALFQQEFGGFVLNYTQFFQRPKKVLRKLYQYIWENPNYSPSSACHSDAEQSVLLTQRERRAETGSAFLGQVVGKAVIEMEELPFYKEKYRKDFKRMVELFEQMMRSATL